MTRTTDQEQQLHQLLELVLTELDRKAIPVAYMQEIDRKGKAFIEQAARRAPAVPVPQGWKLVPVDPTQDMIDAADQGDREYSQRAFGGAAHLSQSGEDHWHAMLAAAPQPPQHEK